MHDPHAAILDMVQAIERAQWAIYSQIIIFGKAAGRLECAFQKFHPDIPWSSAIGMRHRLVHGYDSVDWTRV